MGFIKKEVLIGFLVSLCATIAMLFLYIEYFSEVGFKETITKIRKGGILGAVIALSAIPNLFIFFIFLKKKQDYRARGVLIATFCTALLTFVLKVF